MGLCPVSAPGVSPVHPHDAQGIPGAVSPRCSRNEATPFKPTFSSGRGFFPHPLEKADRLPAIVPATHE